MALNYSKLDYTNFNTLITLLKNFNFINLHKKGYVFLKNVSKIEQFTFSSSVAQTFDEILNYFQNYSIQNL